MHGVDQIAGATDRRTGALFIKRQLISNYVNEMDFAMSSMSSIHQKLDLFVQDDGQPRFTYTCPKRSTVT